MGVQIRAWALAAILGSVLLWGSGCESDDDSTYGEGHDFGDNDPNLYLCIGDSITAGLGGVTPYPSNLSAMLGKPVINQGQGGERVEAGAARTPGLLDQYQPGYLLILHGINDVLDDHPNDYIIAHLRSMILAAKSRQVLPAISTLTPIFGARAGYDNAIFALNDRIRTLAAEEGILLVNNEGVVRNRPDYVLEDGLHLSEAGSTAVAAEWADRL